jgi:hypothetical protein
MSAAAQSPNAHPAPQAQRVTPHESLFALLGGPLAWYLQLCAGYALASQPCFHGGLRVTAPLRAAPWTRSAMILVMLAAVTVALLALFISWRAYRRAQSESAGGAVHLSEMGSGRTRFLALWGMVLGASFAVATAMSAVAFITLPRCAG